MDVVSTSTQAVPGSMNYAGFWIRFFALIIDGVIISVVASLLGLNHVAPMTLNYSGMYSSSASMYWSNPGQMWLGLIYVVGFWIWQSATPGKMILGLKIVDAEGKSMTWQKAAIRYVGLIISGAVLCLGFIFAAFDAKKQGWHDKLAGTFVVKTK